MQTTATISVPASLADAFNAATRQQAISQAEASRRIICGIRGLSGADLRSLPEPPRENRRCDIEIYLPVSYRTTLSKTEQVARMDISAVFRRVLYALLITQEVHLVTGGGANDCVLEVRQMHFEFADDYERDGPSPLLTRRHRNQL
jgi:hypothetical protein